MNEYPKVLKHNLCVVLMEREDKSPGGVYLPAIHDKDVVQGKVVAVGKGHLLTSGEFSPLEVDIDNLIYFRKSEATQIEIGTSKYWILPESSVICIC